MNINTPFRSPICKGSLLIANPEVESDLYSKSVVLVCEHNASGSFGLIINKPLSLEIPAEIINTDMLENPNLLIQTGGPIQIGQMMLLHSSNTIPDQTLEICPGVFLGGNLEFLQEAIKDPSTPHVRLCFGYSGWAAGHLDKELLEGHWFIHKAKASHIFSPSPKNLWHSILNEMGGKYEDISKIPDDPSLN